ncbi:sensor histidine kinase [Gordonia oryzae]|nr:ATP-binding protein [Gordonia oryzae]
MTPILRSVVAWLRRCTAGVRARLTILATVLLAAALAAAAGLMLLVLHKSLLTSADAATSARAVELATTVRTESMSGLDASALTTSKDIDVIQIIGADGRVIAGTAGDRGAPLTHPLGPGERSTLDGATIGDDPTEYRVTVLGVTSPRGPVTIAVAAAEGPITDVVVTVAILFASVFPLILVLLAATTYFFVGRTLRPVEQIRTEVAAITSSDLSRRVSEPHTGDEIDRLATTMNEMLQRLHVSSEAQRRFVGDASHELRSPLVTLVGLLDLARVRGLSIDHSTIDTILYPEAVRLQMMVDDLLLLARSDERGIPLRRSVVDVDDIVADEARRLTRLGGVAVTARIDAVQVHADSEKLSRAIRNIADNAMRHAHAAIRIDVHADEVAQSCAVTIADDGPGIPAADRERVLDRFVRLDPDRRRSSGGSGLGLAIVDEIARAHGGTVTITAAPIGGAAVTITIPVDPPDTIRGRALSVDRN